MLWSDWESQWDSVLQPRVACAARYPGCRASKCQCSVYPNGVASILRWPSGVGQMLKWTQPRWGRGGICVPSRRPRVGRFAPNPPYGGRKTESRRDSRAVWSCLDRGPPRVPGCPSTAPPSPDQSSRGSVRRPFHKAIAAAIAREDWMIASPRRPETDYRSSATSPGPV